ncbi:MAG TPA: SDR family NAD(P)-dependent oxidoreductase [Polyangiaceae bacterium]|jgi:NAD(P)-dependent dehydrogenase (short-subunit alcohol dehydrogenase family)|nr:SDR family NAD(P)-dependent oxidoreductase [Polyangiaceae bacterium]
MTPKSDKRVAFITGENRGIGLETARELGRQGISVVIGARDAESGKRALAQLEESGVSAEVVRYDAAAPDTDRK